MPEVACQECGNALPPTGRFCGRCGKRRDAPESAEEPEVTAAARPRSSVATPILGSLLVAGLLAGGAAWLAAGQASDAVPTEAGSPGTVAPADGGQQLPSASARRVAAADLPPDVQCVVDDVPTPRGECAAWAVGTGDGAEFAHVATDNRIVVGSTAADVIAFDAGTGELRWRWQNPAGSGPSSIALVGGRVVLTLEADHELVALDTDTGDVAWSVPIVEQRQAWIGGANSGDVVGTGRLAVREPTRLAVLDPADGEVVFEVAVPAGGTMPVFVGPLVVAAGEGQLRAWHGATGEPAWQTALDVDPLVPLVSAEGLAVATTTEGEVVAVDDGGAVRWRTGLPGSLHLVALYDGTVAAVSRSGVQVLSLETGAVVSRISVGGRVQDAVGAGPGELLVVTASNVQRIDRELAGETWTLAASPGAETPAVVLVNSGWSQYVVSTLNSGRFLAAFDVLFTTPEHRQDPSCPDARPSEALGAFQAWQNDGAHVGLDFDNLLAGVPSQLWVGLFPAKTEPATVSARLKGDGTPASLRSGQGEWTAEVTLGQGRTSPGWPTHWVAEARFPQAGCWEVTVSAGDRFATVVIAVPQAAVTAD